MTYNSSGATPRWDAGPSRRGVKSPAVRSAYQDAAFWGGVMSSFSAAQASALPPDDASIAKQFANKQLALANRAARAAARARCAPSVPRALAMTAATVLGALTASVGGAAVSHAATAASGAAAVSGATDGLRRVIASIGNDRDSATAAEEARAILRDLRDTQPPMPPPVPGVPRPLDDAARTALAQAWRTCATLEKCVRDDGDDEDAL
ncbi:hypothetical protein NFJ02_04g113560 [Pycnococcus provasolii]